jgi:hypothetical protein
MHRRIFTELQIDLRASTTFKALDFSIIESSLQVTSCSESIPSQLFSRAASRVDEVAETFTNLGRTTLWKSKNIILQCHSYEPEGMVLLGGDRFYISKTETIRSPESHSNNTINDTDRLLGYGFAHGMLFDGQSNKIVQVMYTQARDFTYHLSGEDLRHNQTLQLWWYLLILVPTKRRAISDTAMVLAA